MLPAKLCRLLSPSSSLCFKGRSLDGRGVFGSFSHHPVPAEPPWLVPKQGRRQDCLVISAAPRRAAATPLFSVKGRGTTNDRKSKRTQEKGRDDSLGACGDTGSQPTRRTEGAPGVTPKGPTTTGSGGAQTPGSGKSRSLVRLDWCSQEPAPGEVRSPRSGAAPAPASLGKETPAAEPKGTRCSARMRSSCRENLCGSARRAACALRRRAPAQA